MQNKNKPYCDFHFIIDEQLKNQLLKQWMFRDTAGLSGIVVRILKLMYPRLEKEHFFGKERMSQYQLVTPDPAVKRYSAHVNLPLDLYRRLKLIHHDLNVYSMAQLVRGVLRLYLNFVKRHGEKADQQIYMLYEEYCYRNRALPRGHEILKQLLSTSVLEGMKLSFFTLSNRDFSPVIRLLC